MTEYRKVISFYSTSERRISKKQRQWTLVPASTLTSLQVLHTISSSPSIVLLQLLLGLPLVTLSLGVPTHSLFLIGRDILPHCYMSDALPFRQFDLEKHGTEGRFFFIPPWRCVATRTMASSFLRFLEHTQWRITVRTTLVAWSGRRRDLYLSTHNTHNRQTSMAPVGFEPTISAGERP